MAKNNKKPAPQQAISLKTYIIQNARKLALFRCWELSADDSGMKQIVVARQKKNGHLIVGMYLIDYYCLGLKDTMFDEFDDLEDLEDRIFSNAKNEGLHYTEIDANYAFNFIYGAIEFAEDLGLDPHKDFKITEYILDDVDDIDYIDLEFGKNGKACFIPGPSDNISIIMAKLDRHVGKGNYDFSLFQSKFYDDDDEEYEEDIEDKIFEIQDEDLTQEEFEERLEAQKEEYTDKELHFFLILLIVTIYIEEEFDIDELEERYAIENKTVIEEIEAKIKTKLSPKLSSEVNSFFITIAFENLIFHEGPEYLLLDELKEAIYSFLNRDEYPFSKYVLDFLIPFETERQMILKNLCDLISTSLFTESDFYALNDFQKKRVANLLVDLVNIYEDTDEVEEEWEDLDDDLGKFILIDMYIPKLRDDDLVNALMQLEEGMDKEFGPNF
jgi:hypothetical protein